MTERRTTLSKATQRPVVVVTPLSSDLTSALDQIKQIAEEAEVDAEKIQNGVKSAVPRFRAKVKLIGEIVKQSAKRSLELRDAITSAKASK